MILFLSKTNNNKIFISNNKIITWFDYTDYSFVYLISINMSMLTSDQIEHFNNLGWCFYDPLLK